MNIKYDCKKYGLLLYFFDVKIKDKNRIINFIENNFFGDLSPFEMEIGKGYELYYDFCLKENIKVIMSASNGSYCIAFFGITGGIK